MRIFKLIFSRLFICLLIIAVFIVAIIFLCIYIHSVLPVAVVLLFAYVLSVSACVMLFSSDSPSEFKCAWLVAIIMLPVVGATLFFLTRTHTVKGREERVMPISSYYRSKYYDDGADYLEELTRLISLAKESVYLEFYIIAKGDIWQGIYKNLLSALQRGVEVKIIYDAVGCAMRLPKRDFKRLKRAGAQIRSFHKPLPLPLYSINVRDHRKIAVIDKRYAFTGGVNVADEYAHLTSPHAFWKDGGAMFEGEIAIVFAELFLKLFDGIEKKKRRSDKPTSPVHNDSKSDVKPPHLTLSEGFTKPEKKLTPALPIADSPHSNAIFENEIAKAIYCAERRVHIFTPYLCLGEKLCDALAYARQKGADVKIIIPAVPDKKLTYAISLTYGARLLERGVEVYTYTPGFMHFKGMVCDGKGYIGSYNFDFRSTRLNFENGVLFGGELTVQLEKDFLRSLALSKPLPQRRRNALNKLKDSLLCLFAPLV